MGRAGVYTRVEPSLARLPAPVGGAVRAAWLGLLDDRELHAVDDVYYRRRLDRYASPEYVVSGLFPWERDAVERFFGERSRLLVAAAGAGREMLALVADGRRVEGFDCNPRLVQAGRAALRHAGAAATIHHAPRDRCPRLEGPFDGLILGWTAYSLIPTRAARVAMLRDLRAAAAADAPLLLSFFARSRRSPGMWAAQVLSTSVRRARGAATTSLGDRLGGNFAHWFTRDEIEAELADGGFRPVHLSLRGHPHAVALAAGPPRGGPG